MKITSVSNTTKAALLQVLLLFCFAAQSQTKTTIASLKASPSKTFKGVYYTLSGKDTVYWKRTSGNYQASDSVIFSKNGQTFVRFVPSVKALSLPVYTNEQKSVTVKCEEGFSGTNTAVVEAGTHQSTASVSDANNKALAAATAQAKAGLKCIANPPPSTGDIVLDLSKLPDGSYGENKLSPDLLNATGRKEGNFFQSDKQPVTIFETKAQRQNMEVEFVTHGGYVFLRKQKDHRAIFFYYAGHSGGFSYGIATNTDQLGWPHTSGSIVQMNLKEKGIIKSDERITVGVDGYEVYASAGGKEFFRTKQYTILGAGTAAIQGGNDWVALLKFTLKEGAKDLTVVTSEKLGFKDGFAKGSIEAGSNVISFENASHGFQVGDDGFIPVGGEAVFLRKKSGRVWKCWRRWNNRTAPRL